MNADLFIRLLVPLLLIPLLGISPRPHSVGRYFQEGMRAQQFRSYQSASESLAKAAVYFPWRADLLEQAGILSLKGGDPSSALHQLEMASAISDLTPQAQVALGDAYHQDGDSSSAIISWQKALDSGGGEPEQIINRLLEAHRGLSDYSAAAADLTELLALLPDEAPLYYQLGLLMAATQPETASSYLDQAAALDPQLSGAAFTIRRSINTARLSGEPAYSFLMAGRALASLGEWELAVEAFHKATLERPDYAEAWAFLGEARQHLAPDPSLASQIRQDLEQALSLEPDSIAANSFMAMYWKRQERPDLALGYLETAARLDPGNPALLAEIGGCLSEMGDLPEAQTYFQSAADLVPNDPTYWRLLAEFAVSHQIQLRELALPAAQQAVRLDSKDPVSLVVLGKTLYFLEEYEDAEQYLHRALEIDPDFAPAHLHLGMNYLLQGNVRKASEALEQARSLAPETTISQKADRLLERYYP